MSLVPTGVAIQHAQQALQAVDPTLVVDGIWGRRTTASYVAAPPQVQNAAEGQLQLAGLTAEAVSSWVNNGLNSKTIFQDEVVPAIIAGARHLGMNASIILAQLKLESGNGARVSGRYNYAGIKARAGEPYTLVPTKEGDGHGGLYNTVQRFRDYSTPEQFVHDYLELISSGRYSVAYRHQNIDVAAAAIQAAGYATDPHYAEKLAQVAHSLNIG